MSHKNLKIESKEETEKLKSDINNIISKDKMHY